MPTLNEFDKGHLWNFKESFRWTYLKGKYIYWKFTDGKKLVINGYDSGNIYLNLNLKNSAVFFVIKSCTLSIRDFFFIK